MNLIELISKEFDYFFHPNFVSNFVSKLPMFAYQRANQEALFYWYAMFYYNED